MREFHYTVTDADAAENLDIKTLLRRRFSFSSRLRSKIKRNRTVFLNGEETPMWISPKAGEVITVAIPDETSYFEPEDIPIRPLYEDEDLLIIDKPAGFVVHPTKGHGTGTIANGVAKYMEDTGQSFKIRFINRLDMDTSGVLLLGKNQLAQGELMKQMKADKVEKSYLAMVHGSFTENDSEAPAGTDNPFTIDMNRWRTATENGTAPYAGASSLPSSGIIQLPLGFNPDGGLKRIIHTGLEGKPSETHYRVLSRFHIDEKSVATAIGKAEDKMPALPAGEYSLVELQLKSGRTHQIRVHMAAIGHPLLNDFLYGTEEPALIPRQALHAARLSFHHPVSGEPLTVEAPLPRDMEELLARLHAYGRPDV